MRGMSDEHRPETSKPPVAPAVLREPHAAFYIGIARQTLKKQRMQGRGPTFVRMGRTIVYRVCDLDRFLEARLVPIDHEAA
jgi:hypothetical protein